MRKALVLTAVIGMMLAACAEPSEEAAVDPTESKWSLESGVVNDEEIPIVEDHPITLEFTGDEVAGSGGCNNYFGGYAINGTEITFTALGGTLMACEPVEAMDAEGMYLQALENVDQFSASEDTLTLTGEGVELNFVVDDAA